MRDPGVARVIFLHGASSSGKSTLARAIRDRSERPFVHLSIDIYCDSGAIEPARYRDWKTARPAVFDGLHRSFAAFAGAGNDLIIEHILDTPGWHGDLQRLLAGHRLLFVGLRTAVGELNRREKQRGDRPPGMAERDAATVHQGLSYDLELDGAAPADLNAARVLQALDEAGEGGSKFFST